MYIYFFFAKILNIVVALHPNGFNELPNELPSMSVNGYRCRTGFTLYLDTPDSH